MTTIIFPFDPIQEKPQSGYGIKVRIYRPNGAMHAYARLEIAPDNGSGAPDLGNITVAKFIQFGVTEYTHRLPNDGARRFLRARLEARGETSSGFTAWVDAIPGDLTQEDAAILLSFTVGLPGLQFVTVDVDEAANTAVISWDITGANEVEVFEDQDDDDVPEVKVKDNGLAQDSHTVTSVVAGYRRIFGLKAFFPDGTVSALIIVPVTRAAGAAGTTPGSAPITLVIEEDGDYRVQWNGGVLVGSVRIADSTSGYPSEATTRAATVEVGQTGETGVLGTATGGQDVFITAFAYSDAAGNNDESALAKTKGTYWRAALIGGEKTIFKQATAPGSPSADDLWIDTDEAPKVLYRRNSGNTAWEDVGLLGQPFNDAGIGTILNLTQLSAIAVDVGVLTAGVIRDAGSNAFIFLSGTASGARYIDLTATGTEPFIKHPEFEIRADGSAEFSGEVKSTQFTATTAQFDESIKIGQSGSGSAILEFGLASTEPSSTPNAIFSRTSRLTYQAQNDAVIMIDSQNSSTVRSFKVRQNGGVNDLFTVEENGDVTIHKRNLIGSGSGFEISNAGNKVTVVEAFEVEGVFDVRNAADSNLNFRVEDGGEVQIKEGILRLGETGTTSIIWHEDADASAGNKVYAIVGSGNRWEVRFYNDAESSHGKAIEITRSGENVSNIKLDGVYQNAIAATQHALYVDNVGELGQAASSRRFKKNIKDLRPVWHSRIHDLRVREFDYRVALGGGHSVGLIAEEVFEVMPEIVGMDKDSPEEPSSVYVERLIPYLLQEAQIARKERAELRSQLT